MARPDLARRARALRVVHPFPSFLNAALVTALALVAGGTTVRALALGLAMLGLQFCIGATNDAHDRELDGRTKPWKPIPSGIVSERAAATIALVGGVAGIGLAFAGGPFTAAMALAMLACGLAYDLRLKATAFAWLCFSVAFAILPVYAWYGAVGELPPLAELVIPLAFLAGPALQLSNGLVDLESDAGAGVPTLAARLGRRRAVIIVATLVFVVHGLAWLTLVRLSSAEVSVAVAAASVLAAVGIVLSAQASVRARSAGWVSQAGAIALLAVGWLAAVS